MIALGADHGGVAIKDAVKRYLQETGIAYQDFGTNGTESVDYAPIAAQVALAVADGKADKGILCCGTGIGISIAANKIPGIRAAVVTEPTSAGLTKEHNNSNIICFGGRITGPVLALESLDAWLYSEYMGGRHQGRIDKIAQYEERK